MSVQFDRSTSRSRLSFILAVACGLFVRVGCLAGVEYTFEQGDAASYRASALTLVDHRVFSMSEDAPYEPTAYRPPGYTAFLAMVAMVSRSTLAPQLLQILISLASAILLSLVARRVAPGTEEVVLWVAVLNPFDAVYAASGLSECVTTALLVAVAAAFTLLVGSRRLLVAGALLGLLCLFRDIYLALIPFGCATYLLLPGREGLRQRVGEVAAVGLLSALVIAPWTARNFVQFHHPIPVSAGRLGYSLWMGTWATDGAFTAHDATGRTYPDTAFLTAQDREAVMDAGADVATSEPIFKRLFAERMRAEPGKVVLRWLVRWPRLWLGTRFDIFELNRTAMPAGSMRWKLAKAALFGLNAMFLVGAAVGAVISWRARSNVRWALLPIAFTSLIYLPLNSFENRYSQPMFPFLTLLLAVGAVAMGSRWLKQREGRA